MEKILKLDQKARVSELNGTVKIIIKLYADANISDDTTLQSLFDELTSTNNAFSIAIEQGRVQSQLEDYDEKRDLALKQLYYYLQGQMHSPIEATAAAASTLFNELAKYGIGITKLSYNEETGQISSLLGDLEDASMAQNISAIAGLDTLIAKLAQTQADFEQAYSSELSQLSEHKSKQTASDIKPSILNLLNNKLVVYLRTQIIFNEQTYGKFASEVALAIDKTNQNIKERTKKSNI